MWYKLITCSKKDIEQKFGKETYEIIKNIKPNLQHVAAPFVYAILKKDPRLIERGLISKEQIESVFEHASHLVERKKISLSYQNKSIIIQVNDQQFSFEATDRGFLQFVEKIDFLHTLLFPASAKEQKISEEELNIPEGKITVIKANNVADAITLGKGTTWCISQPKNTMYQSYRQTQASTFYFVFDTTRPEGDPLRRVVVDMHKHGVSLTDLNNSTGVISEFRRSWDAYFEYLENNGVDLNQLKNEPYTTQEKEEYELLSQRKYGETEFENLYQEALNKNIKDPYSKYIGFGHILQPTQFEWLVKMNAQTLIDQYINTGNPVSIKDLNLLKPQQLRTYYRARDMVYDHLAKESTDRYGDVNIKDFIEGLSSEHFMDLHFFNRMIEDPNVNKIDVFSELSKYHYENNLGKEQILKIINSKEIQGGEKFTLLYRALRSVNPEIVDAVINQYPEMIDAIKQELQEENYWAKNRPLMQYLFNKIKSPELFIDYAVWQILDGNTNDPVVENLIKNGYADTIMKQSLTYNYNIIEEIDFLLNHGASLEKAWDSVKKNYYVNSNNTMYIYKLIKKINPQALEEWDREKEETKKALVDELEKLEREEKRKREEKLNLINQNNIVESFNLYRHLRKIG